MNITVEALGPKSGNRLLAAGAKQVMIPCIHKLDDTIDKATQVRGPVTPHIPANRVIDLQKTSEKLKNSGITSVLAISGNPGHGRSRYNVYDLIEHFSGAGFEVTVGSYPEGYLTTSNARHRIHSARIVADKQAAGAHRVITQASFNAENMRQWLAELRNHSITLPVQLSVMPTVPWRIIARMMFRMAVENRKHPIRQINMPNIDLFFRALRSHLQDTLGFIRATQTTGMLDADDGFHVFSYGANVDDLVGNIRDMALQPRCAH